MCQDAAGVLCKLKFLAVRRKPCAVQHCRWPVPTSCSSAAAASFSRVLVSLSRLAIAWNVAGVLKYRPVPTEHMCERCAPQGNSVPPSIFLGHEHARSCWNMLAVQDKPAWPWQAHRAPQLLICIPQGPLSAGCRQQPCRILTPLPAPIVELLRVRAVPRCGRHPLEGG